MANVDVIISELTQFTARQVAGLALGINNGLIRDTPVDTGWAQANWIASIGSPYGGVDGSHEAVTRGAQSAGLVSLASYHSLEVIYISNNVPYIQPLNDGHSSRAPTGFVQTRIDNEVVRAGARNL